MTPMNGYDAYARNRILTASPAELTLMLYEGAIKFCNIAIVACENNDIEKAHNNIRKTDRIIEEFEITLDEKYPVAKDFQAVYTYLRSCLRHAMIDKDPETLQEVLKHLRTMRDTWKDVMKLTANGKKLDGTNEIAG
ncbi:MULTISPECIES: flagellar export chaperone FliS [Pseudobutyrivibrio]|jgi:flagellar protein FliS|uniref:Flagellar secretion chaperone FliS n=2 Tax=Pseudobutyrivibrio TaxID=46205 RepID=A0A2G3ECJ4_9FIRM|nr:MULTISPECIES: flagellar export chaperone FliS [Pseudobutyrivibrio]MBE5904665.1 flagellar export chaperone FliS [Pseudobutyrivibrio sp.]MBR5951822.1 flagellar export chaperone FliS [Pseudobutyrivibrio sp.]NEX02183.1 flagellar export chaperone FliS [Pseudobutyrivibrio xylanivorans]PHU40781.1 flagellar export chaperone FliS [Pseudobutyrivibrio ruminis]SCY29228.1 flagellar protein FliS [Pseudobutyrivibrio sp. AR14]